MDSFKTHHEKIKNLSPEELAEFVINQGSRIPSEPRNRKPVNQQPQHKDINKLWDKFLKDITRLGYIVPTGRVHDQITLHKREFSPGDVRGNFVMELPKGFRRK